MSGVGERKQRIDRKIDVKSTMSTILKNQLYEFAELSNEPVKNIAEKLCVRGMISLYLMTDLSKWLRRDYRYSNTIVLGHSERPRLKLTSRGETGKVSMRFMINDYDQLCNLAYALDLTPSSTATVLIRVTTTNDEFMNEFVEGLSKIDEVQRMEVKQFLSKVWGIQFIKGGY